jgi:predicted RNA-binding Zn ribbon-like protein
MGFSTPAFQLNAGHPVLDLVNTVDNRFGDAAKLERLGTYADLLSFLVQSNLIEARRGKLLASRQDSTAAAQQLRSARELREALAIVFYCGLEARRPPPSTDVDILERHFHAAQSQQSLTWKWPAAAPEGLPSAEWDWGRSATRLELPVWILADSANHLLTSGAAKNVRMCDSETCRWLFLDTSKNHSRRWCDMKICGNRMKARRFLARQGH